MACLEINSERGDGTEEGPLRRMAEGLPEGASQALPMNSTSKRRVAPGGIMQEPATRKGTSTS